MDEDATHTKLRHRQHQLTRYFNRGSRDLHVLIAGRQCEPWRTGGKGWQKGVLKCRIDKNLPQGLNGRNSVHLRKSNETPFKVEGDHDII